MASGSVKVGSRGALVIDVAAQSAQALHAAARAHKREEAHHRREARKLMRDLDRLRRDLAAHGIELRIDTDHEEGSGHSHG